uniref:Uncharacterized protein n=2 Tax=unclassified Mycobacterium TaxID=2642494 RepID=A0A5Q5BGM1_MYCSS
MASRTAAVSWASIAAGVSAGFAAVAVDQSKYAVYMVVPTDSGLPVRSRGVVSPVGRDRISTRVGQHGNEKPCRSSRTVP